MSAPAPGLHALCAKLARATGGGEPSIPGACEKPEQRREVFHGLHGLARAGAWPGPGRLLC